MKKVLNKLFILLLLAHGVPNSGSSQDNLAGDLSFAVNRVYPHISIKRDILNKAGTLDDFKNEANNLDLYFKPSWIKDYISLEISTIEQGKARKAVTDDGMLSQEQKRLMTSADPGSNVSVKVQYLPDNNLRHNEPKELSFTFKIEPEQEAKFPGGQVQLKKYLQKEAIDKIPEGSFKGYDMVAVKFTINEEGEIINAHVFDSGNPTTRKEAVENLLLETVRDMPCWQPAAYSTGFKVEQDFVLIVGNMENCMVHLLNTRRE